MGERHPNLKIHEAIAIDDNALPSASLTMFPSLYKSQALDISMPPISWTKTSIAVRDMRPAVSLSAVRPKQMTTHDFRVILVDLWRGTGARAVHLAAHKIDCLTSYEKRS